MKTISERLADLIAERNERYAKAIDAVFTAFNEHRDHKLTLPENTRRKLARVLRETL